MKWRDKPDPHDYDAAEEYLSLLVSPRCARATIRDLERVDPVDRKAKDILRASGLSTLPATNRHVAKDMAEDELSPVLLVRTPNGLQIADGYHRVCAVYYLDEDADISCKLVSLSG